MTLPFHSLSLASIFLLGPCLAAGGSPAPRMLAVTWNAAKGGTGQADLMSLTSPWAFSGHPLETGRNAVLRAEGNDLYAVCPELDAIKRFTIEPWELARTYDLPRGTAPVDVAIAAPNTAYVTGRNATHLLRLNLDSGTTAEVVDFTPFADPDGIPDLGDMLLDEGRLFVQIRRLNDESIRGYVPPALLAVMDVATETLVDIDRVLPGVQAIQLSGTFPKRPMQRVPSMQRLFLSATGGFFDEGGIEMIDLASLRSLGLVVLEADGLTGADLGPFYLVGPDRGYLVFSTDLTISSHMVAFSFSTGVSGVNLHTEVDFLASTLAYDAPSDLLFFPSSGFLNPGIHVFEGATGQELTSNVVATEGPPTDLALVGGEMVEPNPASLDIALHPCVHITGAIGQTYQIQQAPSVPSSNWVAVTNLTLPESPFLWCDPGAVTNGPRQFYRAVLVQ